MKRWAQASFALLSAALFAGCSDSGNSASGMRRDLIVNGEPSDETDDGVVQILVGVEAFCSGTLVAPKIVVTARHCVSHYNHGGTFSCSVEGELSTQNPGDGQLGATVDPRSIEVHLGAEPDSEPDAFGERVFGTDSLVICEGDLALVVLDRELSSPIYPMRLSRATFRGESMRVVGYGVTNLDDAIGRYRRNGRTVVDVRPDPEDRNRKRAAPNTFVLGEGACQGDSGGPAISEETGALTGVYSLSAAASCESPTGVRNIYTQLAPFSALVKRAFDYAGATPSIELDFAAAGAGGSGEGEAGAATGGRSGTAGTLANGGREVPVGSGSRRDSSCSLVGPSSGANGPGGGIATAVGFALLRLVRRRRSRGDYLQE